MLTCVADYATAACVCVERISMIEEVVRQIPRCVFRQELEFGA